MAANGTVDLDMFVNAASRGFNDGAKVGSPFSSFVGNLVQGFDAELAAEQKRQQIEITQNQIEQLPVANRIQEANADRADAQLAGVRNNPAQAAELAKIEQSNKYQEQVRQEQMMQREQELMTIMQGEDGAAKGQAIISGAFEDVFAAKPQLKKQVTDSTFTTWAPEQKTQYDQMQKTKRSREWFTSPEYSGKAAEHKERFTRNEDISRLMGEIGEGNPISPPDFLENAIIKKEKIVVREEMITPDGTAIAKNPDGTPKYKPGSAKLKEGYNIYYKGNKVAEDVSSDTYKDFQNYKSDYFFEQSLYQGQGGDGDLLAQDKKATTQKELREAAAERERQAILQNSQDFEKSFSAGMTINPRYKEQVAAFEKDRTEAFQRATAAPTSAPREGVSVPVTIPVGNAIPKDLVAPVNVELPSNPGRIDTRAAQVSTWAQTPRSKEEIGAAKARLIMERNKNPSAASATPKVPAAVQAQQLTKVDFPEEVKLSTPYPVNKEAVLRVASDPDFAGVPALVKALIVQESGGFNNAVSPTGTTGKAQVTGATGAGIIEGFDRRDPKQQAIAGAALFATLLAVPTYAENPMIALTAYNGGPQVANLAVQKAGTTDWNVVKNYLEAAVLDPSLKDYWRQQNVNPISKAKEVKTYAEKVIVNMPAFARDARDRRMLDILKQQKVIDF